MNGLRKCGIYTQRKFYAAMRKNEILSFTGKWMELENIILSKVSLAPKDQKIICSPSYVDIRSRANSTRGLDFDHMIKQKHIRKVLG